MGTIETDNIKFETIREFAKRGIFAEGTLRSLCKDGYVPGIYTGKRFLINVSAFINKLKTDEGVTGIECYSSIRYRRKNIDTD